MPVVSLASLLIQETKEKILEAALAVAVDIGLPVTSWQPGDPTRSLYMLEAEELSTLEGIVVGFISSGFLDYASGEWLIVLADQFFGVTVPSATFATTSVVLSNAGGGNYPIDPNDLTFKNSVTNKTYHNTTGGTLTPGPGTTLTVTVEADEAGSDSSAGAGEIDTIVSGPLGVTCTNPAAAIGIDQPDDPAIVQLCKDKRGAFSPDGPKEVYAYVARNADLTGTNGITKVRVYSDSDSGDVTVYLAGPSGAVSSPDVALVEAAILKWATPLCITPSVLSASTAPIAISYRVYIYKSVNKTDAEIEAAVEKALETMFASETLNPIGGAIVPPATSGALYKSLIESVIRGVFPQIFRVDVSLPSGDTAIANNEVAVFVGGGVAAVTQVPDP